ncbi:hypothetical protein E2562_021363 [Oryza meyeriana var. granulata]|uniref:Uncharacterized protein n=1 Tax=Oryza meyeriana var. granulata TaxID=110450 RepID=A0A6G1CIT4_9ORYZ|nr:hypothetical protein E2562_021363 [Oryza meyeriana var. granulata]
MGALMGATPASTMSPFASCGDVPPSNASASTFSLRYLELNMTSDTMVAEVAAKVGKAIDWEGMAKMVVSDKACKEFNTLRRAIEDINHYLPGFHDHPYIVHLKLREKLDRFVAFVNHVLAARAGQTDATAGGAIDQLAISINLHDRTFQPFVHRRRALRCVGSDARYAMQQAAVKSFALENFTCRILTPAP